MTNPTGRDELVERVARAIYLRKRNRLRNQVGLPSLAELIVPEAGAHWEDALEAARAALTTIEASRNDGAAINAMSDVREALDWQQVQIETRRHAGRFVDRADIEAVLKGIAALESLSGGGK